MKQRKFKRMLSILGPGVITGAADDDPSGIATYSQTGAQFGYGQLWTALFMLPLQIAIQEACGRIGAVTGLGIAGVIKEHYGNKILSIMVCLLLIANIINIGADIGAMAAAIQLIIPINFTLTTLLFAILMLGLEIFVCYRRYADILKWLCISLLMYPLTLIVIHAPWMTILKATFVPHLEFSFQFLFIITGVLGTTISPYLFFWQASQEVEERDQRAFKKHKDFKVSKQWIHNLRFDNFAGMLISEIVTWSIIVVAATVLHTNGVTNINTAADAAMALKPLIHTFPHAGLIAEIIFAVGIVGLGLIAIPVLAGSAAYAVGEACNWRVGLNYTFKQAQGFYGVIIAATLAGLCINFLGINPIKALVYTAVINGVLAVPLIFMIAIIANNKKIMNTYKSGPWSNVFIWITFAGMAAAAIGMFFSF